MLRWLYNLLLAPVLGRRRHRPAGHQGNQENDPKHYMGCPMTIESTTISGQTKLRGEWTIEVGDSWPVYYLGDHDPKRLYDVRNWPSDGRGRPTLVPITHKHGLHEGLRVVFKGSPLDYAWDVGTIVMDRQGRYYAENDANTGFLKYRPGKSDDPGLWVCDSAFSTSAASGIQFS